MWFKEKATFRTPCTSRLTRRDLMHSRLRETCWCARIRRTFSPWGKSIGLWWKRAKGSQFMSRIAWSSHVAWCEIHRLYFHEKILLDNAFPRISLSVLKPESAFFAFSILHLVLILCGYLQSQVYPISFNPLQYNDHKTFLQNMFLDFKRVVLELRVIMHHVLFCSLVHLLFSCGVEILRLTKYFSQLKTEVFVKWEELCERLFK